MKFRLWVAFVFLLALGGCSLFEATENEATVTQAPTIPTAAPTPTLRATTAATPAGEEPARSTLNVWMDVAVYPLANSPGLEALEEQLAAFDGSHPDLELNVETKTASGQGGTLSYLRTGRNIAPSVLPDLIMLPLDQLPAAVSEGLVFPLDALISPEMRDDLFAAADQLSQSDGARYAYPFTLINLQHVVYDSAVFTETVPSSWDAIFSNDESAFVFPAAGPAGAEIALQLYLDAGGELGIDAGGSMLQLEPLTQALSQLSRARSGGQIIVQSGNQTTLGQSLQLYAVRQANIALTEASLFLREPNVRSATMPAPLPGLENPRPALLKGWGWAISTPDEAQQALAAELLNWLSSGENMGAWSAAEMRLPARSSALEQWSGDPEYLTFLRDQLGSAMPYPAAVNSSVINALSAAVFDVVSQGQSPQVAAEEAIAELQS